MTELEKVRQFVKEIGSEREYVLKFEHQWNGYNVYAWYYETPYELTGRYHLIVLVKNGKMRCATQKEVGKIFKYQAQFDVEDDKNEDDRWYYDMQSLNIMAKRWPELKEKMKNCSDEKELTLFYEELVYKKYYE